jgi:hypothetical protein
MSIQNNRVPLDGMLGSGMWTFSDVAARMDNSHGGHTPYTIETVPWRDAITKEASNRIVGQTGEDEVRGDVAEVAQGSHDVIYQRDASMTAIRYMLAKL